jgi:ribosomal protein RSM22 (predicted rRNA methylase)
MESVQLPEHVRNLVEADANAVGFPALKRAAAELSAAYRLDRRFSLKTPEHVAAYLVTRMPATYAAANTVLAEVHARTSGMVIESVLDVGAGAGAATLAAQQWFAPCRITLLERKEPMADVARRLFPNAEIRLTDFTKLEALPPHDLVVAAYTLGEAKDRNMVASLWRAARVALVVIEPGTPEGFSLVRDIRSDLLSAGARMLAPCPGEGLCPLVLPDWCHFGARVERSSLHRRLKDAELNYEDEKYSYVALGRETTLVAPARIIRRPEQRPGLIILETCTPSGVTTCRVPKADRERFRAARKATWGDEWRPGVAGLP